MFLNKAEVSKEDLNDAINAALSRAVATVRLMQVDGGDLGNGFTLRHDIIMDALWSVDGHLGQLEKLIRVSQEI
ncbi:MAG: hypothetical protein KAG20_07815 [Cocleimonas sp.]|nr:hypothetical protein [Cocleimonas sp.]